MMLPETLLSSDKYFGFILGYVIEGMNTFFFHLFPT